MHYCLCNWLAFKHQLAVHHEMRKSLEKDVTSRVKTKAFTAVIRITMRSLEPAKYYCKQPPQRESLESP